ncbi:hypothetical protein ROHU_016182 [Labeo rohita]|uniref:Uncharacterized protein n=1 Tax=Labeo rohita TaxID=84645 RepID=A0A498NKX5_LABRO|nr:hypothetical protein ROHU_016182 [Labeo rohita]
MRSASLITVTSRSFIPSRCCSVSLMSADQRDYGYEKATKPTKSEISDISTDHGVKESHFRKRRDDENIRSAARDKPEQRQRRVMEQRRIKGQTRELGDQGRPARSGEHSVLDRPRTCGLRTGIHPLPKRSGSALL